MQTALARGFGWGMWNHVEGYIINWLVLNSHDASAWNVGVVSWGPQTLRQWHIFVIIHQAPPRVEQLGLRTLQTSLSQSHPEQPTIINPIEHLGLGMLRDGWTVGECRTWLQALTG